MPVTRSHQRRGEIRRQLLIDTAYAMLEEYSSDEFSYPEIAKRAGIPLSSCYHFYPSRDELIVAVARKKQISMLESVMYNVGQRTDVPHSWFNLVEELVDIVERAFVDYPGVSVLQLGCKKVQMGMLEDVLDSSSMGEFFAEYIKQYYEVPPYLEISFIASNAIDVWRTLMSKGYVKAGTFDPKYVAAAKAALLGYLNEALPRVIPKREHIEGERFADSADLV